MPMNATPKPSFHDICIPYTLENVTVKLFDLQQADLHIEEIYNLIKSHEDGILLETLAKQYRPKDPTVPCILIGFFE
jgi:hypothetical protein